MFIRFALGNSFGTWVGYLVGVSLVKMGGLLIGTGELFLVGLSMVFTLGYLLESPNPGSVLPGTLIETPIGFWFGSEAVRYWCSCRRLTDFRKYTYRGWG